MSLERPAFVVGEEDGTDDEMFAAVADVGAGAHEFYVLDRQAGTVKSFDRSSGAMVAKVGGIGSGPGQFAMPTALVIDGDEIAVLDREKWALSIFERTGQLLRWIRDIRLPFQVRDVCFLDGSIVVSGLHDDHAIHLLASNGAVLRSLMPIPDQVDDRVPQPWQEELRAIVADMLLECVNDRRLIIAASEWQPIVAGLDLQGSERWRVTITPFAPLSWSVSDDGRSFSFGPVDAGGVVSQTVAVKWIGDDHVLVQLKEIGGGRVPEDDPIEIHVLDLRVGRWERSRRAMPTIADADRSSYYAFTQLPFPRVLVYAR